MKSLLPSTRGWRVTNVIPPEGYKPDANWWVVLTTSSPFRDGVDTLADRLCGATNHRWCPYYSRVADWADKGEKEVARIPVGRGMAKGLAPELVAHMDEMKGVE